MKIEIDVNLCKEVEVMLLKNPKIVANLKEIYKRDGKDKAKEIFKNAIIEAVATIVYNVENQ